MYYSFAVHKKERLDQLFENSHDLLACEVFVFAANVMQEITRLTIVHNYRHCFGCLVVITLVDANKVWMDQLHHNTYFTLNFLLPKEVDPFDYLNCVTVVSALSHYSPNHSIAALS